MARFLFSDKEEQQMEKDKVRHIRTRWLGTAPCNHPNFEQETDLGEPTGNYVCTTCGESLTPDEVSKIRSKRDTERSKTWRNKIVQTELKWKSTIE